MSGIEIGIYSMGDYFPGSLDQHKIDPVQRVHQIIEMAQLGEQADFDIFQIGEAHHPQFVSQSHLVILGAIAQATKTIRIGSSATIVGMQDPVRVYEDAATVDLISQGRMELVCGRGSRVELFDLFGKELNNYEETFIENFELLHLLNQREIVSWKGQTRPDLDNMKISPRALQSGGIPLWYAVSGSLDSIEKAAIHNIDIYVTNEVGSLEGVKALVDRYREVIDKEGYESSKIALASYLSVGDNTQKLIEVYGEHIRTGNEAILGYPYDSQFVAKSSQSGSIINVGEPNLVIEKLLYQHEHLSFNRYVGQIDFGGLSYHQVMKTIDMMGEYVIPQIKKYIQ